MDGRLLTNRRGFSLIEAILAVTIITIIGNWIAMLFLSSTKSAVQVKKMAKATSLEEMVYEQYSSYAASSFFTLGAYNSDLVSAKEFFKTNDNFGYDGFQITTRADYSANQSSCAVQLALNWREGPRSRTKSSSRVFTPQSILPAGANVSFQAQYNGNAVPGLVVTAPSVYGGSTTATTDASGAALLKAVLPGPSILFSIDSNLNEYNAANGQSGYYTTVGGNYTTTLAISTAIAANRFNVITSTAFQPLGTVTGRLINDDDPGVVGGQQVSILQPNEWLYVYHAGGFRRCGTDIDHCSIVTSSSGTFAFYNLITPGNNRIVVDGKWGSDPLVQPGQPGFEYRYINWTETPFDFSASMTWTCDLHIRRMGALRVRPLDSVTGNPLPPGTTIQVDRERLERLTIYNYPVISAVTDPITRSITLYNMVHSDTNGYVFTFYAENYPPPGQGYFLRKNWTCPGNCMGRTSDVDLPMEAGYHFHAILQDANPIPNVNGLKIEFEPVRYRWGGRVNVMSNAGAVDLDGFTPWMGPGTTYNGPATASFTYDGAAVDVTRPGSLMPVTVNLSLVEYNTGIPAPHVKLSVQQTNTLFMTDGAGHVTITQLPYGESVRFSVHCDVQCGPTAPNQLQIDTRKTAIRIGPGDEPAWYIDGETNANYRQFLATDPQNMTIQTAMVRYRVTGNVSDDATHAPVAGIKIVDGYNNALWYTTGVDGNYEAWPTIMERTATDHGHVNVRAAGSDTYPALDTVVIQVPANADPTVPLIHNFIYNPIQGGGV